MYPTKKLWEICEIKTWKKDANYSTDDWKYPFFTCWRDILKSPWYSFDTDAILIAWNWDVWACKKFKWKFEAYQRTYVLDNFQNIEKNFLFYFLDWNLKKELLNETLWSAIPYIKLWSLQNREIPLPPLPIQQKIVVKLDSLFEKLDKAIILTKQNLANIEELNKSVLEKIFKECEEKYEKRKLEEVSTIITWNTPSTKFPEYYWWNILWAWPADIWDNKIINFTSKTLSQKWLIDWKARLVKKWSVLLVSIWTIWKVWIAWQDLTTNQQINSFEVNEKISWDFLYYFFQFYQKILKTLASKTVVPIINKTQCSQVLIQLPPLPEQQKIVEYFDNIFAKNKILQEKYKQDLQNLEELKQSILKQAFEDEDFIK